RASLVAAFLHFVHGMGFRETPRKAARTFLGGTPSAREIGCIAGTRSLVRAGFGAAAGALPARRCGRRRATPRSKKYSSELCAAPRGAGNGSAARNRRGAQ